LSYGTNYDTDILETRCEANKLFSRTGLQGTKKIPQNNFSILLSGTKKIHQNTTGIDGAFPWAHLQTQTPKCKNRWRNPQKWLQVTSKHS